MTDIPMCLPLKKANAISRLAAIFISLLDKESSNPESLAIKVWSRRIVWISIMIIQHGALAIYA